MDELVRWLTACLDEDERIAKAATPGPWEQAGERGEWVSSDEYWAVADCSGAEPARENAQHIAAHDPARVLREIEAKRQILKLHAASELGTWVGDEEDKQPACRTCGNLTTRFPCRTLRLLALPYADRPTYREEWAP